jgi:hypothetical protein
MIVLFKNRINKKYLDNIFIISDSIKTKKKYYLELHYEFCKRFN